MKVKIILRMLIALVVIAGVAFWAFDSVRERNYSGSALSFPVGSGSVVITNSAQEPVSAGLSTAGSRGAFAVVINDNSGLSTRSTREGSGNNTRNVVALELQPGTTDLRVTHGAGGSGVVTVTIDANHTMTAVVSPQSILEARATLALAAVVILGTLYYISRTYKHRWIGWLRQRSPVSGTAT
jgi:hypothetical protein